MWVGVVLCCNSSLLITPVLGSLGSEWLWCLAAILLIMPVFGLQLVSGCGVLWSELPFPSVSLFLTIFVIAAILPCWSCLSLVLQEVSGCGALPAILACWSCLSLALQKVSGSNVLLQSSLLIMPVLGSPGSEWLWCLAANLACWACSWLFRMCVVVCLAEILACWPCLSVAL